MTHPSSHIPHPSARRGSALLIVLGMMAFMVISAVAFSAYMRYSRLPSSYLRRSSASRLLAKAALAEAIDEIDAAIGNNPHPGIGSNAYTYDPDSNSRVTGRSLNRNAWKNRIYLGTNSVQNLVRPSQTVSTLCLEGLAYIPPALVNDARYYSRRSMAGKWQNLAFDSGRYAFCAIDVSDFLNVNALSADTARSSTAESRLTLSYLFENNDHSSPASVNWDKDFVKEYTGIDFESGQRSAAKVPFVSCADFSLALYEKKPAGWTSPFCEYVVNSYQDFYNGFSSESAEADKIRRQAFVTDSYFPEGEEDADHMDLDDEESQPFTRAELRANKTLIQIADENLANAAAFKKYEQCIDPLGFCQLYDYLDQNDEPLSLAIPTVERVPMICGLSPEMANATLTVTPRVDPAQNNAISPVSGTPLVGGQYTITLHVTYEISGLPTAPLSVLAAYPFRHEAKQNKSFEVGGRMAYFLTVEGKEVGLRTKTKDDILHIGYKPTLTPATPIDDAVYAVDFSTKTLSSSAFTSATRGPEGAVTRVSLTPNGIIPNTITFLDVTYEDKGTYQANPVTGSPEPDPSHSIVLANSPDFKVTGTPTCSMKPLDANGRVAADFGASLATTLAKKNYQAKLKLNLAVWAWVKSGGRYVDMVPACVNDDTDLNSRNSGRSQTWGQEHLGRAYPLMRFDMSAGGTAALAFDSSQVQSGALTADVGAQLAVTPQSAMVCDPRFNHAPESWFQVSGALNESTWLANCECGFAATGNGARDGDIFMTTSDNEELQSIFELANLTRFTEFYRKGAKYGSRNMNYRAPDQFYTGKSLPATARETANFDYMWRTYDPFGRYQDGGDDFEGPEIHASCAGFKVTPYSTQTNVMMAAFANTPHEWALSSANEQTMQNVPEDAKTFNQKYAWNAYSSGAKIDWEDLEDLCGSFMYEMQRQNNVDDMASGKITWEDVWADLGWVDFSRTGDENSKYLLRDMPLSDTSEKGRIYSCDRKFLYGFWHDCFALKQQLFLVFVRAEPTMMGGGAVGQTPPALGAKAVALVWRDPTKSDNSNEPHQTRILFYRQFE